MYHIKNDKRSVQSCERIYNALKKCLIDKEYKDITIKDVVDKAEIGRSTFYRNFDHIEDVLRYEIDKRFEELYDFLKEYYKKDPKYFLSFFITPFLKFWYLDSVIIEILIESEQMKILYDAFERLLIRGIKEYEGDEPVVIEHMNYFLALRSGIAINVLLEWIKNNKKQSPEELIEILYNQMKSSMQQDMFK